MKNPLVYSISKWMFRLYIVWSILADITIISSLIYYFFFLPMICNLFSRIPYAGKNTIRPTTILVSVLFCATTCQFAPIHDRLPSASNDPANAT